MDAGLALGDPARGVILWPAGDAELDRLGGKARSLIELARVDGARVPPWFAVASEAFRDALAVADPDGELASALAALPGPDRDAVAACRERIAPVLERLVPDRTQAEAITAAWRELGADFVAVRSSALDEDGADRSFAGCLDTSLYVRGASDVVAAVARCWRSAFSERSLSYRAARGALGVDIAVAVVVQQMIDGRVSGVMFTADPGSRRRDRAVVTAAYGLGEGVVAGLVACDTFTLDAAGAVVDRDLGDKTTCLAFDEAAGSGTRELEIEPERRGAATLSEAELAELSALGRAVEAARGTPVDLEWTHDGRALWLLQARPITTLGGAPATGAERLWDNSNIVESYAGVTTPLTYSFARRAYAMVYRQAFELLGTPRAELERHQLVFEQMIGLLRGRIYYNLESWYLTLRLLPGYQLNAEFMEQMMGVRERASFDATARPSAARRYLVELPKLIAALSRLSVRFARVDALVDRFYEQFGDAYGDLGNRDLERADLDSLVATYLEAEQRLMQRWQAPIVNDILAMVFFGALRKALAAWGLGDASLHNDLLCGEGGLESTEPTRNLLALMADLRTDEAAVALLRDHAPAEIAAIVARGDRFGWLRVRIADHVERFGDRCIDELKLEEPTLRDDPTFLFAALKGYLSAPPITVEDMEIREARIRAQAEARVRAALGRRPDRRRLFDWLLGRARLHVKNRENLRFARTRAFGLVRRLVLAMGARLHEGGALDAPDDVFYLEIGELIGFSRGTATTTDLRGLVAVRRAEFSAHRESPELPDRFTTRGPVYLDAVLHAHHTPAAAPDGNVLEGTGASPGVARAPARPVRNPHGVTLEGHVLIANRTDPGWVPLFPSAAAVVVERGSVLSHSAIVAREFGIPCVVGVTGAVDRLIDGQMIEVDGQRGTVTVLAASDDL